MATVVAAAEAARLSSEEVAVLRVRVGWLEDLLVEAKEERRKAEMALAEARAEERRRGDLALSRAEVNARWSTFTAGAQATRRQPENRHSSK